MKPVLMIPLRRCGSHAIRLRLNFSSDFYSPYPMHIVDIMPLLPLYGDLSDDKNYFQLTLDLVGLQALSIVKWEGVAIDPIKLFERLKIKPRSVHSIAWEILFEASGAHHANVVMDKSLDNVHYWRELLSLHPNMLFVNLVRDPRAQVSSMNRAIIHEFDSVLNAQILLRAHESAQELILAHPEKVHSIRFEDFIGDEENTLKKLCSFLGLEFSKEMLDISRSQEAKNISSQSALWESNSAAPMKSNIDKFKKSLSEQEIEQIETIAGSVLDRYGYARMTPGKAIITGEMIASARIHSAELRKEAWEKMRETKPQDFLLRRRRADYIEMCRRNLDAKH